MFDKFKWEFNPFNLIWEEEGTQEKTARKLPIISKWHNRLNVSSHDYNTAEKEVLDLIYFFVKAVKPKIVVETGSHNGISGLYLAKGLSDEGIVYSIEKNKNKISICNKLKKLYEFNIKFIKGDSSSYDWSKNLEKQTVDLALIDCWERFKALDNLMPYLRIGSYIMIHDTLIFPELKLGIDSLVKENRINSALEVETNRGLTIFRKVT